MDAREGHDIFISYSSADVAWAQAALGALEAQGLKCRSAPRDVIAGGIWSGAIVRAIHGCRVMVLIFSRASNDSPDVTRELTQAASRGVRVLPLRIDDVEPSSDMAQYLGGAHWRTVLGGPTKANLSQLVEEVRRLLGAPATPAGSRPAQVPKVAPARTGWPRWRWMAVLAAAGVALVTWRVVVLADSPKHDPPKKDDHSNKDDQAKKNDLVENDDPPRPDPKPNPPVDPPSDTEELELWSQAPARLRDAFVHEGTEWEVTEGKTLPKRIRHRATGVEFVLVQGGSFSLGGEGHPPEVGLEELPTRLVHLDPYYIARYETTAAQYRGGAAASKEPVVDVSQRQAREWCEKNGLSLPTEAEWEYAASGPENRKFPWGDAWIAGRCNSRLDEDKFPRLAPVGSFTKAGESWCGAEDLAGNVAEWCSGYFSSGFADYSNDGDSVSARDSRRVARGGSWYDNPDSLRTSHRRTYEGENKSDGYLGFRCAFKL